MARIDQATLEQATFAAREEGIDREPERLIRWAGDLLGENLMMSTAFGKSGMCILHMVKDVCPELPVYFIDTGFHFKETLEFLDELRDLWKVNLVARKPALFGVEFVKKFGDNLYETDPDLCCHKNKVEPFRELFGEEGEYQAWIAGVRRDQSSTRAQAEGIELMGGNLVKIQPLAFWTKDLVDEYTKKHDLPQHPLFSMGYNSIGGEPCTSACGDSDDERAGRWAGKAKTECGLHTFWHSKENQPQEGGDDAEEEAEKPS